MGKYFTMKPIREDPVDMADFILKETGTGLSNTIEPKPKKHDHKRDLLIKTLMVLERLAKWKAMAQRPHQVQILELIEEIKKELT